MFSAAIETDNAILPQFDPSAANIPPLTGNALPQPAQVKRK
jgi:hypothetical protein